jgi:drug/metabolite transporter (DMT)-like permease
MARALLVALTLLAFAGNSLLCRRALDSGRIDAASFTAVRLLSGALLLALLARGRPAVAALRGRGSLARAAALFAYAALFSWAYVRIPASVGALVLFASVQLTMLGGAVREGAGPRGSQWAGVVVATAGLAALTLPGAARPDLLGAVLMVGSGAAWGVYSLLGRSSTSPLATTAAAFRGALPFAVVALAIAALGGHVRLDVEGAALAVASGAVTSALGYVLWYAVLPSLGAVRAAVVQLAVPAIAALGGALLLGEAISMRLVLAGAAVLGGIALTLRGPASAGDPPHETKR